MHGPRLAALAALVLAAACVPVLGRIAESIYLRGDADEQAAEARRPAAAAAPSRPNILFILTDDQDAVSDAALVERPVATVHG